MKTKGLDLIFEFETGGNLLLKFEWKKYCN